MLENKVIVEEFNIECFKDHLSELLSSINRIEETVAYIKASPDIGFTKILLDEIMMIVNEIDFVLDFYSYLEYEKSGLKTGEKSELLSDSDRIRLKQILKLDDLEDSDAVSSILYKIIDRAFKDNKE